MGMRAGVSFDGELGGDYRFGEGDAVEGQRSPPPGTGIGAANTVSGKLQEVCSGLRLNFEFDGRHVMNYVPAAGLWINREQGMANAERRTEENVPVTPGGTPACLRRFVK